MIGLLAQVQINRDRKSDSCVVENGFCPNWIAENFTDRYVPRLYEHTILVIASVLIGFVLALGLALLAHRRRALTGPIAGITGAFYTVPSIAAFLLLLPLTGRGRTTAIIALVAYTLLIIFRNITAGLRNVPEETKDAARGMGLTERQLLFRVELPLAVPELLAGLRIATTSTVGLAYFAIFAGAGGLGAEILDDTAFRSNVVTAGALGVLLAVVLDLLILVFQRGITPWQRARTT
jgi:osmoprotectant transport system permease protein